MKVQPIKSGVFEFKIADKHIQKFDLQKGMTIEVPESIKEELKKEGFIAQTLEKKNKKEEK